MITRFPLHFDEFQLDIVWCEYSKDIGNHFGSFKSPDFYFIILKWFRCLLPIAYFFYKRMYKKVFFNYNQKITQNFIKMNNKVCHTYIQYRYGKIRSQNSHSKQQSQSYIYWQFLELLSFWPCVECQCCMPSKIVESKSYIQKLYVLPHYRDMRTGNT